MKTEASMVLLLQEFILRNTKNKKSELSSSSTELSEKALADFSQVGALLLPNMELVYYIMQ